MIVRGVYGRDNVLPNDSEIALSRKLGMRDWRRDITALCIMSKCGGGANAKHMSGWKGEEKMGESSWVRRGTGGR